MTGQPATAVAPGVLWRIGRGDAPGIRYLSRVCSDWECWAVFDDVDLVPLETKPITLDMPALQRIATLFQLQVF